MGLPGVLGDLWELQSGLRYLGSRKRTSSVGDLQ